MAVPLNFCCFLREGVNKAGLKNNSRTSPLQNFQPPCSRPDPNLYGSVSFRPSGSGFFSSNGSGSQTKSMKIQKQKKHNFSRRNNFPHNWDIEKIKNTSPKLKTNLWTAYIFNSNKTPGLVFEPHDPSMYVYVIYVSYP